jgi:hypothetical protein
MPQFVPESSHSLSTPQWLSELVQDGQNERIIHFSGSIPSETGTQRSYLFALDVGNIA